MKTFVLLFVFSIAFHYAFANKIDELTTDSDVARFIVSVANTNKEKRLKDLVLNSTEQILKDGNCGKLAESWGIKNWEKADFNGDGLTDILININQPFYRPLVINDNGNGKFSTVYLGYSLFEHCEFGKTINSPYGPLVLFHTNKSKQDTEDKRERFPETDTLIYKFNAFIELNKKPAAANIASVKFHTGRCMGTCPDFYITIDARGNGYYQGGSYDKRKGSYTSTIKTDDLKYLFEVLAYIDVKGLKNNYAVNWTDDVTSSLTIKFDDGSVKEIKDYGELGTFGLRRLYDLFFYFRDSKDWEED